MTKLSSSVVGCADSVEDDDEEVGLESGVGGLWVSADDVSGVDLERFKT